MRKHYLLRLLAVLLGFSLLAAACGDHTICIWDISSFTEENVDTNAVQESREFDFKGGTLICVEGRRRGAGSVSLYQGEKFVWSIGGLNNPRSAEQLPNGNVLISEHGYEPRPEELQVTERTPENKTVSQNEIKLTKKEKKEENQMVEETTQ